jgi:hypothetical protein
MKTDRKRAILASVLPLAMLVSACGSGNDAPAATDQAATSAEPVESATEGSADSSAAKPTPETPETNPAPETKAIETKAPETKAASKPKEIPVRGPGGLEGKCLARVKKEMGGKQTSTNRIDESQAATDIYVNVDGVEAPWRCRIYRDGTIDGLMYTGSEGAA